MCLACFVDFVLVVDMANISICCMRFLTIGGCVCFFWCLLQLNTPCCVFLPLLSIACVLWFLSSVGFHLFVKACARSSIRSSICSSINPLIIPLILSFILFPSLLFPSLPFRSVPFHSIPGDWFEPFWARVAKWLPYGVWALVAHGGRLRRLWIGPKYSHGV